MIRTVIRPECRAHVGRTSKLSAMRRQPGRCYVQELRRRILASWGLERALATQLGSSGRVAWTGALSISAWLDNVVSLSFFLHLQRAGPRKARPLAFSPLPSLSSPRAPLPLPNPNQPCARGVAGLRSCPVTPTSSPLRSAPCHAAQTSVHERRREARMCGSEGKLGRVGGAQSASLPSTCKGAPPRTSPDAQTPTPMRFHPVLRAPAPPVHASPWSAPPSSASRRSVQGCCVTGAAAAGLISPSQLTVRMLWIIPTHVPM